MDGQRVRIRALSAFCGKLYLVASLEARHKKLQTPPGRLPFLKAETQGVRKPLPGFLKTIAAIGFYLDGTRVEFGCRLCKATGQTDLR